MSIEIKKLLSIKSLTQFTAITPVLISFFLLVPYFILQNTNALNNALLEKGNSILNQLTLSSEYGLISGNTDYLNILSEQLLKNEPELQTIKIYNHNNELILEKYSTSLRDNNLIQLKQSITTPKQAINTFDHDDELHVSSSPPLIEQQQMIGSVVIDVSKHLLKTTQQTILFNSLLLALAILVFSIAIAYLLSRKVVKPLSKIVETVNKISSGNLQANTNLNTKGEIGELATNIDNMASNLNKTHQELNEHIHQLTAARETAEHANAAKTEFLALISHEIRTPMNAATGMLQALEDTSLNNIQRRYVKVALDSSYHLTGLIDDILDFSQLNTGRISISNEYCDIKKIIQQIINNFSLPTEQKGLQLQNRFEGQHTLQNTLVLADPTRLKQILINLIGNAIKFTDQGAIILKTVWQPLSSEKLKLTISVQDTGIGIADERIKNLFNSFERVEPVSKRNHNGTGLGLSISKQLTELMGGTIEVQSKQNVGSIFTCEFSFDYVDAHSTSNTEQPINIPECTILLVEDNSSNQETFAALFRHYGVHIDIADNGFNGLKKIKEFDYDLIFIDCHMPKMDGFELAKTIRQLNNRQNTPLIAITADVLPVTKEKCFASGMDDFISKPVSKFNLYSKTINWLKAKKQVRTLFNANL